jgi:tRNA threonylcarbamoyladenosine biosynthesis protein TsaB
LRVQETVLAIDTSTHHGAVGLALPGGRTYTVVTDPAQKHGRSLVPAIQSLLEQAGLAAADLGAIAVGLGPGSYTGLRIGLTVAKTLVSATGKPLLALDSLEIVARAAPPDIRHVAVIADAQRGTLYTADFAREAAGGPLKRLTATQIEAAEAWRQRLEPGTLVLSPDIDRLRAGLALPESITVGAAARGRPAPGALLELAYEALARGEKADVWFLEPLYLRASAAEEKARALASDSAK